MPRPIQALIHPPALAHNLRRVRQAAPDAKVWAMVKADAYGHGVEQVYPGLQGADGFCMLDFSDAQRVRQLGWRGPILMVEGCFEARDLEWCSRLDLWHVVHHEGQIDWLAAHKTTWPQTVFLKLNAGMNRLGFSPPAYRHAWLRLSGLTQVDRITHMTHFSDADGPIGLAGQKAVFDRCCADLPGERTLCNSAAILRHAGLDESVRGDWVRPGIMLYGSSPDATAHDAAFWDLQPAMSLRSRLIALHDLTAGATVGYGSLYTAPRAHRLGVVACGYADGYPRTVSAQAEVLVEGVRCPVVGRVSMDMLTVDLTPCPQAVWGSEVTLWGRSRTGTVLPVDAVAAWAGRIGYELLCARSSRVPVLVDDTPPR